MPLAGIKDVLRLTSTPVPPIKSLRAASPSDWPRALRVYLGTIAVGGLAWEAAHLPLYTIWRTGTPGEKAFAVVHCTGGDLLIALTCLALALLLLAGEPAWPVRTYPPGGRTDHRLRRGLHDLQRVAEHRRPQDLRLLIRPGQS